jgi:hypothetical protein
MRQHVKLQDRRAAVENGRKEPERDDGRAEQTDEEGQVRPYDDRNAAGVAWWKNLAAMDRAEFNKEAAGLVGPGGIISLLRTVVTEGSRNLIGGFTAPRWRRKSYRQPSAAAFPLQCRIFIPIYWCQPVSGETRCNTRSLP